MLSLFDVLVSFPSDEVLSFDVSDKLSFSPVSEFSSELLSEVLVSVSMLSSALSTVELSSKLSPEFSSELSSDISVSVSLSELSVSPFELFELSELSELSSSFSKPPDSFSDVSVLSSGVS